MRRLALRLLLSAAALVFFFGATELTLRLLPVESELKPDWTPEELADHAVFWAPLGETHNPLGVSRFWKPLRGIHYDIAPEPGVRRLICLGGSSVYGWPFEEASIAWPAQLERRLDASGRWEILNAGEGGFTTFQALVYLEKKLLPYQAEAILLCAGANDGADNLEIGTTMSDEEYWEWVQTNATEAPQWEAHRQLSRFRTYVLVKRVVHSARVAMLSAFARPKRRVPVERFEVNLRKFVILGAENGFKPILLTEPHRNRNARPEYFETMRRVGEATETRVIDLHALLPEKRDDLFLDEMHLTEKGHEAVGEILARELRR